MKTKQIFTSYRYQENQGLGSIRYCLNCGSKYELKEEGGRLRPVCSKCGSAYYKNPSPAVSILITDNQRVLLCKRAPGNFQSGKWCLPCGFIEFNEDFLTAARREVKEETGLDVEIQSIINVASNFLSPQVHSIVIVLLARISGGKPEAGDDIEALDWAPLSGPLPEMAFEADSDIIEKYKEGKLADIPVIKGEA